MTPALELLMVIDVDVATPTTVDPGDHGRRFIPIIGGRVTGPLTGWVLEGGGDWQTLLPGGSLEIGAHYMIEIDGQGLVEVKSEGVRHGAPDVMAALSRGEQVDPASYYFRTFMRFHTAVPGISYLNHTLAVSAGRRSPGGVHLDVFRVT